MPNVVFFAVPILVGFKFLAVISTTTKYLIHFLSSYSLHRQTKVYEQRSKIANCSKVILFELKIRLAWIFTRIHLSSFDHSFNLTMKIAFNRVSSCLRYTPFVSCYLNNSGLKNTLATAIFARFRMIYFFYRVHGTFPWVKFKTKIVKILSEPRSFTNFLIVLFLSKIDKTLVHAEFHPNIRVLLLKITSRIRIPQ